jgi:hypothetical protein
MNKEAMIAEILTDLDNLREKLWRFFKCYPYDHFEIMEAFERMYFLIDPEKKKKK